MSEAQTIYQLTLPPSVTSAGAARRFVRTALLGWGLTQLVDTAALLTTEVVTNSVLHARTAIHLTVTRDATDGVTIAVHDASAHLPQRRTHASDSTTGRGLELLDALAASWRVERDGEGKTLTFSVRGDPWSLPLGRYDSGSLDEELHEVVLRGTPVRLFAAGREHHDDLMREHALLALSDDPPRSTVPQRLTELVGILGVRYGRAGARPTAEVEEALAAGRDTVDLRFQVPAHVVESADVLQALMDEADAFCASEQLLTVRRSDAVRAFSRWYLDEFRRQVAGETARPWTGPLDP